MPVGCEQLVQTSRSNLPAAQLAHLPIIMPFRFPWQKATDTDNSAEKQSLTKPSPTSNSASLDPSEAVINPSSSTMVADLKSKLNQFEANVMKDGDAAISAKMLTELKVSCFSWIQLQLTNVIILACASNYLYNSFFICYQCK